MSIKPDFIKNEILKKEYDGISDDLLTGGLGKEGLEGPAPIPEDFTAETLRKLAIYSNYRGLLDPTRGGGYGVFYGPGVGAEGSADGGRIAGKEYLAFSDDGTGQQNVTLMVQIPDTFNPDRPRIITAPSSGSRGIYGAIGVVGEWGLKNGFAVAYTDKGTGMGVHDLDSDTVNRITGERKDAAVAGKNSNFTAASDESFRRKNPHRIAFKHAHSRQNPEADWGKHVLQSVKFAFYILNLEENFGRLGSDGTIEETVTRENTIVIASGISNGGSASIRAAEQDTEGLIDGVAVSEPNASPMPSESVVIRQGSTEWTFPNHSRAILDYITLLNIYQPCANLDLKIRVTAPMNLTDEKLCINRCNSLVEKGLLTKASVEEMAAEAQKIINDHGILPEQNLIQPSLYTNQFSEAIAVTYANAYGKFGVAENLCGFSFAAADPETKSPAPLTEEQAARLFAEAAGVPPVGGVELINDHSEGGPMLNRVSVSAPGIRDMNLQGALCLRRLATGKNESGEPLGGEERIRHERISEGMAQVRASGNLRGLPALIVHGRDDAILPPNHTSRAYAALNHLTEGTSSKLRYYEVTNAHHLDAFNQLEGFSSRYIPLQCYLIRILDMLCDHLENGTPLLPSQVVRTTPRGILEDGTVPDITAENVPPISPDPGDEDKIVIEHGNIAIPE